MLLADTITGRPLAVMDSMVLTAIRTAATAMLAAGFGACKDSKVAAIIGCGMQGRYQADALKAAFRLKRFAFSTTTKVAHARSRWQSAKLT